MDRGTKPLIELLFDTNNRRMIDSKSWGGSKKLEMEKKLKMEDKLVKQKNPEEKY